MTSRRSTEQWQRLIAEYESSEQAQSSFCAARGVAQSTFAYWRRKLRSQESLDAAPAFVELTGGSA